MPIGLCAALLKQNLLKGVLLLRDLNLFLLPIIKTKKHDDFNCHIFSLAFFSSQRKASDGSLVPYPADYAYRLDSRGDMGCALAAECKSGQAQCKAYPCGEIEIKRKSPQMEPLKASLAFRGFLIPALCCLQKGDDALRRLSN